MIIRDWQGILRIARACLLSHVCSPLALELFTIRKALMWCVNNRYNRGEICIDSKLAIMLVLDSDPFLGLKCFLIDEVRTLLQHCLIFL